jgi:hypothetical protein
VGLLAAERNHTTEDGGCETGSCGGGEEEARLDGGEVLSRSASERQRPSRGVRQFPPGAR